jgi:2-iminoacetate synthase
MFPLCKYPEKMVQDYLQQVTPDTARQSLNRDKPTFTDFMNLISPAAAPMLEEMRERAAVVKRMHFGKTVRLYSPLYVSNWCINDCVYCGFRNSYSGHQRRRLTVEEVINEAKIIRSWGIESLLLVSGEDPKGASIEFFEEIVHELKKLFAYISIEIYPMDEAGYRRLFEAGVHGLTIYQETYDRELYKQLHLRGPKADYDARLAAVEAGGRAGFYNLGIGALLGLSDWRLEAVSLAAHGIYLKKKFWRSRIQFSFPRITPTEGGFDVPDPVSEPELEQMMLAFRLFFHESDLYVSTRETHTFRSRMAKCCASHLSAGSQVVPGGYRDAEDRQVELGQFTVNDLTSVAAVKKDLKDNALEAVFKDWDPSLGI